MEVFCLRVGKDTAGKKFPFDRVYIVNYEDRAVIEQLFRYALVLPVEGVLREQLEAVKPDSYTNRTFDRNDAESAPAKIDTTDWVNLFKDGEWVMVVPLLPKWMKRNVPQYLVAESWYDRHMVRVKGKGKTAVAVRPSPFTGRSYLQTPHKKIRPICVVCPRMILHQNGECQIGEKICFESLPLGMVNHFDETMALPEQQPNMREPEEYKLLHGEEFVAETPITTKTNTKDLLRIIHE